MDDKEELANKLHDAYAAGYQHGEEQARGSAYDDGYHEGADQAFKELWELVAASLHAVKIPMRESVQRHKDWLNVTKRIANNLMIYNNDFDRAEFLRQADALSAHTAKFFALTEKK